MTAINNYVIYPFVFTVILIVGLVVFCVLVVYWFKQKRRVKLISAGIFFGLIIGVYQLLVYNYITEPNTKYQDAFPVVQQCLAEQLGYTGASETWDVREIATRTDRYSFLSPSGTIPKSKISGFPVIGDENRFSYLMISPQEDAFDISANRSSILSLLKKSFYLHGTFPRTLEEFQEQQIGQGYRKMADVPDMLRIEGDYDAVDYYNQKVKKEGFFLVSKQKNQMPHVVECTIFSSSCRVIVNVSDELKIAYRVYPQSLKHIRTINDFTSKYINCALTPRNEEKIQ